MALRCSQAGVSSVLSYRLRHRRPEPEMYPNYSWDIRYIVPMRGHERASSPDAGLSLKSSQPQMLYDLSLFYN